MKRYWLIYRGIRKTYYRFDTQTKKRESLGIDNTDEAQRLVDIRNEAARQPTMNLQIAQVYPRHSDPALAARTWEDVMRQTSLGKTGQFHGLNNHLLVDLQTIERLNLGD